MQQRLEEAQSEKEQLHDSLIAAEIKLDRLRSGTVVAMQTKFGTNEETAQDQLCPQEETTQNLGSSTPPVSGQPAPVNGYNQTSSSDVEDLRAELKISSDRATKLETEIKMQAVTITKLEIEVRRSLSYSRHSLCML